MKDRERLRSKWFSEREREREEHCGEVKGGMLSAKLAQTGLVYAVLGS